MIDAAVLRAERWSRSPSRTRSKAAPASASPRGQAVLQAQAGRDLDVRRTFAIIALEEQEHAALSDALLAQRERDRQDGIITSCRRRGSLPAHRTDSSGFVLHIGVYRPILAGC